MPHISSPRSRRGLLAAGGALLAGVTVLATQAAGSVSAAPSHQSGHHGSEPKPTVVLVHGAFADASSWNGVIKRLKREGYPVIAPANPLRGLGSDADYLASALKTVKGPIVLAGHSYGGSVISEAAVGNPNVKALVYVAAFIPEKGESALELTNKFPGSTLPPTTSPSEYPLPGGGTGTELTIKQDKFRGQFAGDVPAQTAELMAVTQRPVAVTALEEKTTGTAWKDIPSYALVTTEDKNIPAAALRFMAGRAHARTVETRASHAVTVSRPETVSALITRAAKATSR
ncbi:alpha/beta hydrolase [Streptomyces sp. NBC_00322]|uniref:alpha/beta fold hydrolase n=1 Tax=Streptomyces sp. NBC_00322 TaxID=2975712 RepID=UPI002E287296|nr:alpha/beta hydrolase [Streptomyces sp. NBC_00322]